MSAVFEKPILNSISDLELNMSSNIAEFTTFDLNFYYNKLVDTKKKESEQIKKTNSQKSSKVRIR
jgi:hypothetical protein